MRSVFLIPNVKPKTDMPRQLHQALETCALDLAYQKRLHEHDLVQGNEKYRRMRLQLLLLEDENDHLHAYIAKDDEYIQEVEDGRNAVTGRVKNLEASLESAQGELRIKGREIETLKVHGLCAREPIRC